MSVKQVKILYEKFMEEVTVYEGAEGSKEQFERQVKILYEKFMEGIVYKKIVVNNVSNL